MKEITFQIGDKLRIRDWDDMRSEYGCASDGGINVPWGFFDAMQRLCGRAFTVKHIRVGTDGHIGYTSEEDAEEGFLITAECLAYRDSPESEIILEDVPDAEFFALIAKQKSAKNFAI